MTLVSIHKGTISVVMLAVLLSQLVNEMLRNGNEMVSYTVHKTNKSVVEEQYREKLNCTAGRERERER